MSVVRIPKTKEADLPNNILRIHIADEWTADDLAAELSAIGYLHNIIGLARPWSPVASASRVGQFGVQRIRTTEKRPQPHLTHYIQTAEWGEAPIDREFIFKPCTVSRFVLNSPGIQDFAGIGKALREIFSFIRYLLETGNRNELHDANLEKLELENDRLRMANEHARIKYMKSAGFTPAEIRAAQLKWLEKTDIIAELVIRDRIVGVEFCENEEDEPE